MKWDVFLLFTSITGVTAGMSVVVFRALIALAHNVLWYVKFTTPKELP